MRDETLQRGEHVSLRRMDAADEAAFLRAVRSSRKLHRPWSYLPENTEDFRDMLVRPLGESYLICRNEDGALAGSATLGHIVFGNLRSAYLGYSAFVPHQRRGFMTEGLELVLRHAFGALALHRVEVNVQPDNARSIALAERLGFRREGYSPRYLKIGGRWRDHVRFAMLADEFSPATARRRP
jgi:ribosomal-protein-alanine N-acetyltransferase